MYVVKYILQNKHWWKSCGVHHFTDKLLKDQINLSINEYIFCIFFLKWIDSGVIFIYSLWVLGKFKRCRPEPLLLILTLAFCYFKSLSQNWNLATYIFKARVLLKFLLFQGVNGFFLYPLHQAVLDEIYIILRCILQKINLKMQLPYCVLNNSENFLYKWQIHIGINICTKNLTNRSTFLNPYY